MRKNKLLLLLALLMTAATGAWADETPKVVFEEHFVSEPTDPTAVGFYEFINFEEGDDHEVDNGELSIFNSDGTLDINNWKRRAIKFRNLPLGEGKTYRLEFKLKGSTRFEDGINDGDDRPFCKASAQLLQGVEGHDISLLDSDGNEQRGEFENFDESNYKSYSMTFVFASEQKQKDTYALNNQGELAEKYYLSLSIFNPGFFYLKDVVLYEIPSAASGYTVTLKDGVKDADKWTISPNPAEEGQTVTLQYTGRLKVKGVTATSDEKPAEASVPDGAINGKFSVSSTKKVYFSKGNLRYASSKWSFFDNQYDYYTSYSADAWDKFGWSTSATTYGMSTSSSNGDYSGDFVDWGATMGAGWRTLTSDEWAYLLKTRSASTVNGTENGRYAKAKVNDVGGVILFPDTYTHPDGVAAPTGVNATDEYGWEGNSYTAADWTKMESAGCVFLPAAGCRYGSEMIGLGSYGYYGSATPDGADYAYRVKFNSGSLEPANSINRCLGCSVRLVQEATSDAVPAKPAATVTTAPTGAEIVGVGKTTALVSGGVADGGTLMYAVTTTNTKPTSTAGFSDAVPTAKDITASGKVYVWYYVKADDTHSDSEIAATAIEVPVADIVVWDATNVSDLGVFEGDPYEKEFVTLSSNAENVFAWWDDFGDSTRDGIEFEAEKSGGYTFTAPTGKAFTKIEMTLTEPWGWDNANLGTGWAFNNSTVTWKGTDAASTVELLTDDIFAGATVKSIVFYLSE